MKKYLDYSAARLNGGTVRNAGYHGVIRYIDTPNSLRIKHTSKGEYDSLRKAGLDVYLVFENHTGDADGGYSAGVANAKRALAGANHLGYKGPIFFCNDKPAVNVAPWRSYLKGAASVLGKARVGAYGFANAMDAAKGYASYFWQAGRQADVRKHVHVYQWNNGRAHVGGVDCDINYVYKSLGVAKLVNIWKQGWPVSDWAVKAGLDSKGASHYMGTYLVNAWEQAKQTKYKANEIISWCSHLNDRLKESRQQSNDIWKQQKAILKAIKAVPNIDVDEKEIVKGVLEGVSPESIAKAMPKELAEDVVDKLSERLGKK